MNQVEKPGAEKPKTAKDTADEYRAHVQKIIVTGLPVAIVQAAITWAAARLTSQPWHIVWFLLPLAVAGWLVWRAAMGRRLPTSSS